MKVNAIVPLIKNALTKLNAFFCFTEVYPMRFLIALTIAFSFLVPSAAQAQTSWHNYKFFVYFDGSNNGVFDNYGLDDCRGGATITVTEVVPMGQLAHFVNAPITHNGYDVLTFQQRLDCRNLSTATYALKASTQYRMMVTIYGVTHQKTFVTTYYGGTALEHIRIAPASGE